MPERTHYDVLGVPPDATQDEIKQAWKRHLKYWHPDHNAGPDAGTRAKSLNQAFDVLSDPVERREYDRKLATGQPVDRGNDEEWPPAWTPPPGRYRARKASRPRTGPAAGTRTAPSPPPPAAGWDASSAPADDPTSAPSGGPGRTLATAMDYTRRAWRYLRVSVAWMLRPLQDPALTPGHREAVAIRVGVLGGLLGLIWLVVPYLGDAVSWVGSLLTVAFIAVVIKLGIDLSGSGPPKKRSGRRTRRR